MQVDFYQLAGTPAEQIIASIAEKVLGGDGRLIVVAEDEPFLASSTGSFGIKPTTSFRTASPEERTTRDSLSCCGQRGCTKPGAQHADCRRRLA